MFGTFWEDSYDTLMVLHHVASVFFCTIRISQSSGLFQQLHSRKWQASTFNGHSPCGDSEEKGGRYRLHSNLGHWWHAKNMLNKYVQLWDVGVITIVIAVFSDTHTFHKSSDSGGCDMALTIDRSVRRLMDLRHSLEDLNKAKSGWCYTYPSEKYEFVSWGYYSQYMDTNVPNHQPEIVHSLEDS